MSESNMEQGHGDVPVVESDDFFINDLDEQSAEDSDDVLLEGINDISFAESEEDTGDLSAHEARTDSTNVSETHRHTRTLSRHKCTLADPNTGEPCNADFSRAG